MTTDDVTLLKRWQRGDRVAADELLARYVPVVSRLLTARAGDAAPDLVQNTFLDLLQEHDVDRIRNMKTFVLGMARNRFLMWKRRVDLEERSAENVKVAPAPTPPTTPSQGVARREREDLIAEAIQDLPEDSQIALQLYYWERLSLEEIARITEVSPGAVKSRLHRARARVEAYLYARNVEADLSMPIKG